MADLEFAHLHAEKLAAACVQEGHVLRATRHVFERLLEAQPLKDAHHLTVEVDGARDVVDRGAAIDGQHPHATLTEEIRGHRPGGPVAADQDFRVHDYTTPGYEPPSSCTFCPEM